MHKLKNWVLHGIAIGIIGFVVLLAVSFFFFHFRPLKSGAGVPHLSGIRLRQGEGFLLRPLFQSLVEWLHLAHLIPRVIVDLAGTALGREGT